MITLSFVSYSFIPGFTKTVRNILLKETEKLKVNASDISKFLDEATREQFFVKFSQSKKILIMLHYKFRILGALLPLKNKYIQYKGQFVGQFLMSTDFFINKMDESKTITYQGFYNPYKQPCSNPFSFIFYS